LIEHHAVGASWEGFVDQQTRSLLSSDMELWFFCTHEGAEADIVLSKKNSPIASAKIKWTNAPKISKGFRNVVGYLKTENNFCNYTIFRYVSGGRKYQGFISRKLVKNGG